MGAAIEMDCPILGLCVCCACFSQLLDRSRRGSVNSAMISLEHCENAFYKLQRLLFKLKTTLGEYSIEFGTQQIHYKVLWSQISILGRLLSRILNHYKVL